MSAGLCQRCGIGVTRPGLCRDCREEWVIDDGCRDCGRPLRVRGSEPDGRAQHAARGLCIRDWNRHQRDGDLADYPTIDTGRTYLGRTETGAAS